MINIRTLLNLALIDYLVGYITTKCITHARANISKLTEHNKTHYSLNKEHSLHNITVHYHNYQKTEQPGQKSYPDGNHITSRILLNRHFSDLLCFKI